MKKLIIVLILAIMAAATQAQVKVGIEMLRDDNFNLLEGKRVGLITNPTGVDRNLNSTLDILFKAPNVKLVALYGPEHGIRGDYFAGEQFDNATDPRTGLPVFSLHGRTRKPTPEMLKGVDVLVYDVQDIGSRSYTYISSMGLAMEAAAENNIEVIILDRPNPLGGIKIEGPIVEPGFVSFVSQFPIPYLHGMTVGELATYINEEKLLTKGIKCKLTIVKMKNWARTMDFEATGLPWVISSPHIPRASTAAYCASSGILGELYTLNVGIGYTLPFEVFGAGWIDAEQLAKNLNALKLGGILFRPIHYKPFYSTQKDSVLHGVQMHITNMEKAPLTLIQFYVLQECHKLWPDKNVFELCDQSRWRMFDQVCGTDKVRKTFSQSFTVESINKIWTQDVELFKEKAKKHLLYN